MAGLPPLPPLNGADFVLAVYSHHSLPTQSSDEYGDPSRLAVLGARIMDQAIVYHFFSRNPPLSAEDIERCCRDGFPDMAHLLHAYGQRNKIRAAPGAELDSPEEARAFFNKYIGAVYMTSGMGVIQEWVSQLIEPGAPPPPLPGSNQPQSPQGMSGGFAINPPPPSGPPPPPPPSYYPPTSSPTHNGSPTPFQILAAFNQMAQQRGFTVSYPARSEGQHHMPTWNVQCCVNGEVKGEGMGKNQKQAKEMAARQAWTTMGWGNLPG